MNNPRLRPLDFQPVQYQGQPMWLLRDPLQLTDEQLVFPHGLAQMLMFIDGTRDAQAIHSAFCEQIGQRLDYAIVQDTLAALDQACLLDNERTWQAKQQLLADYRAQPFRWPSLADQGYPSDPDALTTLFERYAADDNLNGWGPWQGQGVISPHIDYQRGGPVYAKVWRRAETAVLDADLILIFGTDHNGGFGAFTLTRQAYATPYGVLPTDLDVIDAVAAAIGPSVVYEEEIHHRQEHSIELSAVWLHYIYQRAGIAPKPMIPILCGSFHHFITNGNHPNVHAPGHPGQDELLMTAVVALQQATSDKTVLAVASVDFAHVGPTFGDPFTMDQRRCQELCEQDQQMMQAILRGDAADFYNQIAAMQDQNRICGFSSIYLMLKYLETVNGGNLVAYEHCPADPEGNSLVSIGGILLD